MLDGIVVYVVTMPPQIGFIADHMIPKSDSAQVRPAFNPCRARPEQAKLSFKLFIIADMSLCFEVE